MMSLSRASHVCYASDMQDAVRALLDQQRHDWPMAREGLAAVARTVTRTIAVDDLTFRLQFNPARLVSTGAKVDPATLATRKCFLCPENRPTEQRELAFENDWLILVNPFPILPDHFTVAHRAHVPQRFAGIIPSMLSLSGALGERFVVFYNGPKAGASAPDHLHMQIGAGGVLPIENEIASLRASYGRSIDAHTTHIAHPLRPLFVIEADDPGAIASSFDTLVRTLPTRDGDEPSMNLLCWRIDEHWRVAVIPRTKHRPSFYFFEGEDQILLSPGTVDMAGVCVVPVERDYHRITADTIRQMLREVAGIG